MREKIEKKIENPEKERKLTPKQRYVLDFTIEGKVLKEIKNFKISSLKKLKGKQRETAVENLKSNNVLKIENDKIEKINWENLERFFEKTRGGQILKFINEYEVLNVPLLEKLLDVSPTPIRKETFALLSCGLVARVKVKEKYFFVPLKTAEELEKIRREKPFIRSREKRWEEKIMKKFEENLEKISKNSSDKLSS